MLSPHAPPGLDSVLGRPISRSPDHMAPSPLHRNRSSATQSDDSDDTIEISDLDEEEGLYMGFPLQRMGSNLVEGNDQEDDDDRLTALYTACLAARLESNHDDAESEASDTSSLAWDDL